MTQTLQVLEHMKKHGHITPKEAMDEYGIMRLGARIYDLKHSGYRITCSLVSAPNRYGIETRFAQYALMDDE